MLDKPYIKMNSKSDFQMPSNYIGKNLEGMQKYFSASNIRYKVINIFFNKQIRKNNFLQNMQFFFRLEIPFS